MKKKNQNSNNSAIPIAIIFFLILGVSVLLEKTPISLFCIYIVLSFITFIIYAGDKAAAKRDEWRISEKALHFLSLIGGWPGALFGQKILRHKSQKQPFRTLFWFTVIINIGVLLLLHTPEGKKVFQNLDAYFAEMISNGEEGG